MITVRVRVPLRICLAGGGTDLPAYFRQHGGFVVSATIDKYLLLTVEPGMRQPGAVGVSDDGQLFDNRPHPYALAAGWPESARFGLTSDVPPGSGLGGSGALMVALLKARCPDLSPYELAMAAYNIERYALGQPCGYQDHVVAAYGGCVAMQIERDGRVSAGRAMLPVGFVNRLALFATDIHRDAGRVLGNQTVAILRETERMKRMQAIHRIGFATYDDLMAGGRNFGVLCHEHWLAKTRTTGAISTSQIDQWYMLAREHGAEGGKCIGAGAGGYMLFVIDPAERERFVGVMEDSGLVHTPFQFVEHGAEVMS